MRRSRQRHIFAESVKFNACMPVLFDVCGGVDDAACIGPTNAFFAMNPQANRFRIGEGTGSEQIVAPAQSAILIMVIGQSNARKAGTSGLSQPARYAGLTDAQIWTPDDPGGAQWATYVVDTNSGHRGDAPNWGSEAEFIYQINQAFPGREVYVIKEAVNGQSLNPDGAGNWYPTTVGSRFEGLEEQVTAAKAELSGRSISFSEVVAWNQGEADTDTDAHASAYQANMVFFLQELRSQITTGTFIIERIRPYTGDVYNRTYTIREAQENVRDADSTVRIIDLDFDPTNFSTLHPGETWTEGAGLRVFRRWEGTYDANFTSIDDTTPSNLSFTDVTDVAVSTVITSTEITIEGINRSTAVSVTSGEYRVRNTDDTDWLDWTSSAGTINPFQKLQIRQTSSASNSTPTSMNITVGTETVEWTITTEASSPTFETETDNFIATLAANSGAAMSGAQSNTLNQLFIDLKAETGLMTAIQAGRLYIGGMHDQVAGSIDIGDQTTLLTDHGGAGGSVAWTADDGWSCENVNNRGLDLKVNPSTDLSQNDAAIGGWITTASSDTSGDINDNDGVFFARILSTGAGRVKVCNSSNINQSSGTYGSGTGFWHANRSGASAGQIYSAAGTEVDTFTTASTSIAASTSVSFGGSGGTGVTSDRVYKAFWVTSSLTAAQVLALRNALNTFFTNF